MEFRKMVMITLYGKQKKRHRYIKTDFWTLGEGESGMLQENSIESCILSRVKWITSPGWLHETSVHTWCTGKTQRDRVESEVGAGSGCGIHVYPWLIHVNVWQKPLQYCKVISFQLIKKIKQEKKRWLSASYEWPRYSRGQHFKEDFFREI